METEPHLDQIATGIDPLVFRTVNDIVRDLERDRFTGTYNFVCECEDGTCTRVLRMTGAEYDALRADADCFAVIAGHERRALGGDVVGRTDSYVIVRRPRAPEPPAPSPPRRAA